MGEGWREKIEWAVEFHATNSEVCEVWWKRIKCTIPPSAYFQLLESVWEFVKRQICIVWTPINY